MISGTRSLAEQDALYAKGRTFEEALNGFKDYICNEVLAKEIVLVESLAEFDEVEMNEDMLQVKVELN